MRRIDYIKCHGSGNIFIMIDTLAEGGDTLSGVELGELSRSLSRRFSTDGILIVGRDEWGGHLEMKMLNPDGSSAQMCGNGMRCVARCARAYAQSDAFEVYSGGDQYAVWRTEPVHSGVETYGVDIRVRSWSPDFGLFDQGETFVGRSIEPLDPTLRFTALSLGNPHVVAPVEGEIDMQLIQRLGERVQSLPELFPNGVNVSLFRECDKGEIYVATFERGAGITYSCGTAMSASATAAALLGLRPFGESQRVLNRGGAVVVEPRRDAEGAMISRLEGNATYTERGWFVLEGSRAVDHHREEIYHDEIAAYDSFVRSVVGA